MMYIQYLIKKIATYIIAIQWVPRGHWKPSKLHTPCFQTITYPHTLDHIIATARCLEPRSNCDKWFKL